MIGIIEYGAGNTGNVLRALSRLGVASRLLETPDDLRDATTLLLPGVGAFGPAMKRLRGAGWADALLRWNGLGKPILGICLGMQLLCESSDENGFHTGLSVFRGRVEAIRARKRLHMGWNEIRLADRADGASLPDGAFMYFVHGYCVLSSPDTLATTEFENVSFASALRRGRTVGFQFHPERSGPVGLRFLASVIAGLEKAGGASGEESVA